VILVDSHDAAHLLGVKPATLRKWAERCRDRLPRRGTSSQGRAVYSWADLLAVHRDHRSSGAVATDRGRAVTDSA
jgi:hypothetical protein